MARRKRKRVVAIAGFSPDSRAGINDEPDSTEILAINNAHQFLTKPAAMWFQLHPSDWHWEKGFPDGSFGRSPEHLEYLKTLEIPVYMRQEHPDIPHSVRFPLQEIVGHFGISYFTSTMAYIMGLILMQHDAGERVGEIKVFGINLTTLNEYYHQKACMEYWLGEARGRGIKVWVPETSGLLKGALYAREVVADDLLTLSQQRVEKWRTGHQVSRDELIEGVAAYQETKAWREIFKSNKADDAVGIAQERMDDVYATVQQVIQQCNSSFAALREAQNMHHNLGGVDVSLSEAPQTKLPNGPFETYNRGELPVAPQEGSSDD